MTVVDEAQLEARAMALLVECDPLPRGCGAEIGVECTSTSKNPFQAGKPLGRQVAHYGRLLRAGLAGEPVVEARRCRQTALPVDECDHCARWAELARTAPHRLGRPIVAQHSGTCTHCTQSWAPGAAIARVIGGSYNHLGCSTDPPDDDGE